MDSIKRKTSAELRELIQSDSSAARVILNTLFDNGTFVELGTYVKRASTEHDDIYNEEFEGVVTGYGAIDGRLVFAFLQDFERMKGALGEAHSKKICSLYDAAIKNSAPVIGIFNSAGAHILEGISSLSGYGKIMKKSSEANGLVPQIAVISGLCSASSAVIASMFDFVIGNSEDGKLFVNPPFILREQSKANFTGDMKNAAEMGVIDIVADTATNAVLATKSLTLKLPQNFTNGTVYTVSPDDANRLTPEIENIVNTPGYDMKNVISLVSDDNHFIETSGSYAPEIITGFSSLSGVTVGICASQPAIKKGVISANASKKAAKLIDFCGKFNIPLITLVDSEGFDVSIESEMTPYSSALALLAFSYATYDNAKITVIIGKAYGAAYTLLGSKSLGIDIVFALDSASISIMQPESAIEFAFGDKIKTASDPSKEKASLLNSWREKHSSPLAAARNGDIDDIISYEELRQRIAAAVEMQTAKYGG